MSRLDAGEIRQALSEAALARLQELEVFVRIGSTNTHLMERAAPAAGCFRVAVADEQTAGRGRQSRRWISPPGAGLYLSLAYTFACVPPQLPALTLALGIGVIATLERCGNVELRLKWPNDIIARDAKLGGILTEARSPSGDGVTVVTGVGLNVDLPDDMEVPSDATWFLPPVDLATLFDSPPSTSQLAGRLIEGLFETLLRFEESGFDTFAADWRQRDWLHGRGIVVELPDGELAGIAAGVESDGALILDVTGGRRKIASGSITRVDGAGLEA
jgi:BirA family biotin operon repressor/biotin-[acetyl-CoA-carboxylase] ligase